MPDMFYVWQQPFRRDANKFRCTFGMELTLMRQASCESIAWFHSRAPAKR